MNWIKVTRVTPQGDKRETYVNYSHVGMMSDLPEGGEIFMDGQWFQIEDKLDGYFKPTEEFSQEAAMKAILESMGDGDDGAN